jgi:AcrR family transcriptional regulator
VSPAKGDTPAPAPRKRGRPRGRTTDREKEIVETAAHLFYERGYANTSVQDIAEAVGILKASVYYYIRSKEDLLFQILVETHDGADVILEEVASRTDLEPLDRLRLFIERHVADHLVRNREKVAIFYRDVSVLSPARRAAISKRRRKQEKFAIGLVEDAQAAGDIDPGIDARMSAFLIYGTMNWIHTWYKPAGEVSPEALARLCSEVVLNGLGGARPDAIHDGPIAY